MANHNTIGTPRTLKQDIHTTSEYVHEHPKAIALGASTLVTLLTVGGLAGYDQFGPRTTTEHQVEYMASGETPIQAAQTAADALEERGVTLNRVDVTQAAQMAHLGPASNAVRPQNIELLVSETPIFHHKVITVASAENNEK